LPAVLVECGFLTNPGEASHIVTPGARENLAQAIAAAIERY
jgi:N-acetylmuramoyl-L-alanine amidase